MRTFRKCLRCREIDEAWDKWNKATGRVCVYEYMKVKKQWPVQEIGISIVCRLLKTFQFQKKL